jgi:hypothetical protein
MVASRPSPEAVEPLRPASGPPPTKRPRKEHVGRPTQTRPTIGRRAAEEQLQTTRIANLLHTGPNPKGLDLEAGAEAVQVAEEDIFREIPGVVVFEDDAN